MRSERPTAAPPRVTTWRQRPSGSAVLSEQRARFAGRTPRRAIIVESPRPLAPWHIRQELRKMAAPLSLGDGPWMVRTASTASIMRPTAPDGGFGRESRGRTLPGQAHESQSHRATQPARVPVRLAANLLEVRAFEHAVPHHDPAVDHDVADVAGLRAVDDPRNEVGVFGLGVRTR